MYKSDGDEFDLNGGVQFGSLKDLMAFDNESYSKQDNIIKSQIPSINDHRVNSNDFRNLPDYGTKLPMRRRDTEYNLRPTYHSIASETAAQARHIEESRNPVTPIVPKYDIPSPPVQPAYQPKKVSFAEELASKVAAKNTEKPATQTPSSTHTTYHHIYPYTSYSGYLPLYRKLYDWSLGYIPTYYSYSERQRLEQALDSLIKRELIDRTDEHKLRSLITEFLNSKIGAPVKHIKKTKKTSRKGSPKRKPSKKPSKKKSKSSKKSSKKSKKRSKSSKKASKRK